MNFTFFSWFNWFVIFDDIFIDTFLYRWWNWFLYFIYLKLFIYKSEVIEVLGAAWFHIGILPFVSFALAKVVELFKASFNLKLSDGLMVFWGKLWHIYWHLLMWFFPKRCFIKFHVEILSCPFFALCRLFS